MRTKLLFTVLGVLATFLVGCSGRGSQEGLRKPKVDLATMKTETEAIVVATVATAEPKLDKAEGRVYTHHTLKIDQVIDGKIDPAKVLEMRIRGGAADGIETQPLKEVGPLTPGDTYLLFLRWFEAPSRPELSGYYPTESWQSMARVEAGTLIPVFDGPDHPMAQWRGQELGRVISELKAKHK